MFNCAGVTVFPDGDRCASLLSSCKHYPSQIFLIQHSKVLFRYEGEYFDNHMDGVGVYTWKDGV